MLGPLPRAAGHEAAGMETRLGLELVAFETGWALAGKMTPDGGGLAIDGDLGVRRGGSGALPGVFGGHVRARFNGGVAEDGVGVKGRSA